MDAELPPNRVPAYLRAASLAVALLERPEVAQGWETPSALDGLSVGGLAGHLSGQVFGVAQTLDSPVTASERLDLPEHYAKVAWVGSPLDDDVNVSIRAGGERAAAIGPVSLAARVRGCLEDLQARLPTAAPDLVVQPPWLSWALHLSDFLTTRLMEVAVHSDDLAVSVGLPTPPLPPEVADPVFELLTRLAVRRHGQPAVLRALTRAERAPETIVVF